MAIQIARDGQNYTALEEIDTVSIDGDELVLTVNTPFSGALNKIKINSNALKNEYNYVLASSVETNVLQLKDIDAPQYQGMQVSSNRRTVEIAFNEDVAATGSMDALKEAIKIVSGNTLIALDSSDTVSISGAVLTINLASDVLVGKTAQIKIAGGNLQDNSNNILIEEILTDPIANEACFIATAAYGSYLDPHVYVLRNFRDQVLAKTSGGRKFIAFYYENSPRLAAYISLHQPLRWVTRLLLTPVIYVVMFPYQTLLGIMVMVGLFCWSHRKKSILSNEGLIV